MVDIIIVGAGPAGLTAALYALRANKKVLILEAKNYGGQIIKANRVVNYPGIKEITGYDFATTLYDQVISLGGKIKFETVIHIDEDRKVITNKNTYQASAIILATGVQNRKLNLKNEEYFVGKGVSYCAICDGNFYKNKVVAVVGGGNTAVEDAIYLSDIASKVYLIHRGDVFRSEDLYLSELNNKNNISIILNSNITALNGNDFLTDIVIKNSLEEERILEVSALFIAVGQEPKNTIFSNIVTLDKYGYIVSSDGVHTDTPHIYVAGDARVKSLRQLTTAVGDGSIAATTAIKEIGNLP